MFVAIATVVMTAAIMAILIIAGNNRKTHTRRKSPPRKRTGLSETPAHKTSPAYEPWVFETPEKRAGRLGEHIATNTIESVLRGGDYLLTNVTISYDGKTTELDNVVVNKYGVFIIEVKNYKGRIYGEEDDQTWTKYKDDGYGNTFVKEVRNPIKQVKRQVYILSRYLAAFDVWIEGYVFLIQDNSPVKSTYVIETAEDIDRVIHTFGKKHLSARKVEAVRDFLSQ